MDVEEMNNLSRRDFQVAADATAGLAARGCQIVNANFLYRKAAQHHVAIHRTAQLARFANAIVITGGIGKKLCLILFPTTALEADDFLQGNHVSLQFIQHFCDA